MFAEDMPLLIAYSKRHNETFLFTQSDEAKHFPYIEDNALQPFISPPKITCWDFYLLITMTSLSIETNICLMHLR